LTRPNGGISRARNTALREATGDLVAFLDADDLWEPQKLSRQLQIFDRHPEVGLCFTRSGYIDPSGARTGVVQKRSAIEQVGMADFLTRCPIWTPSCVMVRRGCLDMAATFLPTDEEGTRWFNPEAVGAEDMELWFRMVLTQPCGVMGTEEVLTWYRFHPRSVSAELIAQEDDTADFEAFWDRLSPLARATVAAHRRRARAYLWSVRARKALLFGAPRGMALHYMRRALSTDPGILLEEPYPTLLNLGAALVRKTLPDTAFHGLERAAQQLLQRSKLHDWL
jgi:glycosyltransferase involved in cell wall biosynthesis